MWDNKQSHFVLIRLESRVSITTEERHFKKFRCLFNFIMVRVLRILLHGRRASSSGRGLYLICVIKNFHFLSKDGCCSNN